VFSEKKSFQEVFAEYVFVVMELDVSQYFIRSYEHEKQVTILQTN